MAESLDDMMYLQGLTYLEWAHPGRDKTTETEAKSRVPRSAETASTLQEWKRKVIMERAIVLAIQDPEARREKMAVLTTEVTHRLASLALKASKVCGKEELTEDDTLDEEELAKDEGLAKLIEAVEKYVLTFKADEEDALIYEGSRKDGLLSRQEGETMASYVNRRRRWFARLITLDSNTKISEKISADYLLRCANLTYEQELKFKAIVNNERDEVYGRKLISSFEKIAHALVHQHAAIHIREKSRATSDEQKAPDPKYDDDNHQGSAGSTWIPNASAKEFTPGRSTHTTSWPEESKLDKDDEDQSRYDCCEYERLVDDEGRVIWPRTFRNDKMTKLKADSICQV